MKRYKMPRKLKKAMKSTVRQYKEYGELFNKIYTSKGYDQIHFDLDDCESEEEADALRAESKRLINIVCEEVEAMIHHRKSKWQAKADAIMNDWEGDEDLSNNYFVTRREGKYTNMLNEYWNEITKDW